MPPNHIILKCLKFIHIKTLFIFHYFMNNKNTLKNIKKNTYKNATIFSYVLIMKNYQS